MAIDEAIVFEGRRWPGAHEPSPVGPSFDLMSSGGGRQWSADRPAAFWRNFSALTLFDTVDDREKVQLFLARHGDPTGQMDRRAAAGQPNVGDTSAWPSLIAALKPVAAAWDDVDALGVSAMTGDKDRLEAADKALEKLLPGGVDGDREISKEIEVAYTVQGITLRPKTLRSFMAVSAASARERAIQMRRCAYCDDWFELRRTDAFYCSSSCQATHYKRRVTLAQQLIDNTKG